MANLTGTEGADTNLATTESADTVNARGGADRVDGRGGNDLIRGGLGNDVLRGGSGADRLLGEDGNDILNGDGGNDVLEGGFGADTMLGGADADTYHPGTGNDFMHDVVASNGDFYSFGFLAGTDVIMDHGGSGDKVQLINVSSAQSGLIAVQRGTSQADRDDLYIFILNRPGGTATADRLQIRNYFQSTFRIESIVYSDGRPVDLSAVTRTRSVTAQPVAPASVLPSQAQAMLQAMATFDAAGGGAAAAVPPAAVAAPVLLGVGVAGA